LKPIILDNIINEHHRKITDLVVRERRHPQEHAKYYDKYSSLITKQVRGFCMRTRSNGSSIDRLELKRRRIEEAMIVCTFELKRRRVEKAMGETASAQSRWPVGHLLHWRRVPLRRVIADLPFCLFLCDVNSRHFMAVYSSWRSSK
jgi:hypothetical protein